jgi:hypothetical protein
MLLSDLPITPAETLDPENSMWSSAAGRLKTPPKNLAVLVFD